MELRFVTEGVSTELRHREIQDIRGFYTAGRHVQRAGPCRRGFQERRSPAVRRWCRFLRPHPSAGPKKEVRRTILNPRGTRATLLPKLGVESDAGH
jgi:hypothetical protein